MPLIALSLGSCGEQSESKKESFEKTKFRLELQDKLIGRYGSLTNYSEKDVFVEYENRKEINDLPYAMDFTEFLYFKIDSTQSTIKEDKK